MKIRIGFVSNSSSASFVIEKKYLSIEHLDKIRNHIYYAKQMSSFDNKIDDTGEHGRFGWYDEWDIDENDEEIWGWTPMTNFDMIKFLETIGVDMYRVRTRHS